MESSKSEGNEGKKSQDTNVIVVDNQTIIGIIDPNVEKEIQNVLVTSEYDQERPSCSWKDTELNPIQTESKQPEILLQTDISLPSITIDVNCPPKQENAKKVEEDNNNCSKVPSSHQITLQNSDLSLTSSLTNLFNDIDEILEPMIARLPKTPVTNQPRSQPPPPNLRNSEVPPTASRGIHVINFPNDSINRSLQRQDTIINIPNNSNNRVLPRTDPVLGPPPSYSKSLLDRRVNTCASIQFVAPIPPPSYDGMESELRYAHTLGHGHTGGFTLGLGNTWQGQPQPAYCPVCETVIITQVDVRVSRIAHIVAMVMFLLLCWPFCLLPYFLNVCNYTFHYCSVCHSYLGARRPFQRS